MSLADSKSGVKHKFNYMKRCPWLIWTLKHLGVLHLNLKLTLFRAFLQSNILQGISAFKMLISLHWLQRELRVHTSMLRMGYCTFTAQKTALFENEKRRRVKKINGIRKSDAISKKKTKNRSNWRKKQRKSSLRKTWPLKNNALRWRRKTWVGEACGVLKFLC